MKKSNDNYPSSFLQRNTHKADVEMVRSHAAIRNSKKPGCGDVNARVHVWSAERRAAAAEGVSDGQISGGGGAPEGGVLLPSSSSLSSSHALAPLEIGENS